MRCVGRDYCKAVMALGLVLGLVACANQFDVDELEFGDTNTNSPNTSGVCEESNVPGFADFCQNTSDCNPPLVCIANACLRACNSDNECPGSQCLQPNNRDGDENNGSGDFCIEAVEDSEMSAPCDLGGGPCPRNTRCLSDGLCHEPCNNDDECDFGCVPSDFF